MDAHGREYLAAAAETGWTGPRPPAVGSVVWHRYGRGLSCSRVLAVDLTPDGLRITAQRSQAETLTLTAADLEPPPRCFSEAGRRAPEVGVSIWFSLPAGGQSRGVVESVSPDGLGLLVRETETGDVVEVAIGSVLPF